MYLQSTSIHRSSPAHFEKAILEVNTNAIATANEDKPSAIAQPDVHAAGRNALTDGWSRCFSTQASAGISGGIVHSFMFDDPGKLLVDVRDFVGSDVHIQAASGENIKRGTLRPGGGARR